MKSEIRNSKTEEVHGCVNLKFDPLSTLEFKGLYRVLALCHVTLSAMDVNGLAFGIRDSFGIRHSGFGVHGVNRQNNRGIASSIISEARQVGGATSSRAGIC
jgi:hypothetical protein